MLPPILEKLRNISATATAAQTAANEAQTAASSAQTVATEAQTTANEAKTAATEAQGGAVQLEARVAALEGMVIVPVGGIILWSGATNAVPQNWHLCDGTNGTPDLRDRFVVGAGSSYTVGATGGSAQVTLTTSQMPSHSHTLSGTLTTSEAGAHSHTVSAGSNLDAGAYGLGNHPWGTKNTFSTSIAGAHTHTLSGGSISFAGGSSSHENRPPYYALAYIMRVSE